MKDMRKQRQETTDKNKHQQQQTLQTAKLKKTDWRDTDTVSNYLDRTKFHTNKRGFYEE